MLKFSSITDIAQRDKLFDELNTERTTWLVSDLQSKLDLQKRLLSKTDFLEEDSVLRASELWQKISTQVLPDFRILPKDLILVLCRQRLQSSLYEQAEWAKRPGTADQVFKYITQMMPILSHPTGKEVLDAWFDERRESKERWGRWADLSFDVWDFFLEKRVASPQWVSGAIANSISDQVLWKKELVVDLGANLTAVEAELFKTLSKHHDVHILQPTPDWHEEFIETTYSYNLLGTAEPKEAPAQLVKASFFRFTSMIAEVKHATGQVRQWLDLGVQPSQITVVAADIESYWQALRAHFSEEGIPVSKRMVTRLQCFPGVAAWLSEVRLQLGKVQREDLELRLFSQNHETKMKYEVFERLFSTIYGKEDLERDDEVKELYGRDADITSLQDQKTFLAWAVKFWAFANFDQLENIVHRVYADCPRDIKLNAEDWLTFIEGVVARTEIEITPGERDGVGFLNLSSMEHRETTHVVLLGATESSMVEIERLSISRSDVLSLVSQTGFLLPFPENKKPLFELKWLSERALKEFSVLFPETDFSGTSVAPSLAWLEGRLEFGETEERDLPIRSRFDEMQGRQPSEEEKQVLINEEEGFTKFAERRVESLSATSLERYDECPFRFASEKVFGLSDLPSLDLDIDRMTKGALLHKVFEKVLPNDRGAWNVSDSDLAKQVDESYKDCETQLVDERLWPPLREKYIGIARRFLQFEQEWQAAFPATKTCGKELAVKGYFRLEDGKFYSNLEHEGFHFRIRGSIDRVDTDENGNYALLDYKSTKGSLRQFGSWRENGQYQMALYTMAFEAGLTRISSGKVVAGLYYVVKDMNRETGFKLTEGGEALFSLEGRSKNKLAIEEKESFLEGLSQDLKEIAQSIHEGHFNPVPKDEKTCVDCKWKKLCRARHLQ